MKLVRGHKETHMRALARWIMGVSEVGVIARVATGGRRRNPHAELVEVRLTERAAHTPLGRLIGLFELDGMTVDLTYADPTYRPMLERACVYLIRRFS